MQQRKGQGVQLNNQIESAFAEIIHAPWSTIVPVWMPAVDVYENFNAFILIADLPGVENHEIALRVEGKRVTLCGSRTWTSAKEHHHLMVERSVGRFCRTIILKQGVDEKNIQITFKAGVYQAIMPKLKSWYPDTIEKDKRQ